MTREHELNGGDANGHETETESADADGPISTDPRPEQFGRGGSERDEHSLPTDTGGLCETLGRGESLLIACHNDPDPDAIASAVGLQVLASHAGVSEMGLVYDGQLSHQENRAMVNALEVDLAPVEEVELDRYDSLALVDHGRPGDISPVPADRTPDVVLDHHATETVDADHVEQVPGVGATATLVADHLRSLSAPLDGRTATALYFAMHRETLGFTRGTTAAEHELAAVLVPAVEQELVRQLLGATLTAETADAMGEAIRTREVRGSCLVASVGECAEPDAIPQAADYLLGIEGVTTTAVYGLVGETARISARTSNTHLDIGAALREAFADVGSAGGHGHMAGAQLPLGLLGDALADDGTGRSLLTDVIRQRLFNAFEGWAE